MDPEPEELQFLGLFGLYREAAHIVSSWRRLVLPLYLLFLVEVGTRRSYYLRRIDRSADALTLTSASIFLRLLFRAAYILALRHLVRHRLARRNREPEEVQFLGEALFGVSSWRRLVLPLSFLVLADVGICRISYLLALDEAPLGSPFEHSLSDPLSTSALITVLLFKAAYILAPARIVQC